MKLRFVRWFIASLSILFVGCPWLAAQSSAASSNTGASQAVSPAPQATTPAAPTATPSAKDAGSATPAQASDQSDPLKRPLTPDEKKKNSKALKQELSSTYKKWLKQDVVYIITPEEMAAFKKLSNDEERDQFIENFWLRRDPTPDTPENEYKEEHYRRIAYANEHFGAGIPGWKTDRGRIYIMWGPADQIESASHRRHLRPSAGRGRRHHLDLSLRDWRYRYLEGVGQNIELEFVDPCSCGDYHLTSDPNEKDALLHTPGGATMYEQMGMGNKANRMDPFAPNASPESGIESSKEFDKMEMMAKVQAPPPVKFKDLEEVVSHKINVNLMPFEVRTDYVKVTGDTVLVPFTVQVKNKDITFASKDGIQRGTVNIFGRVTGITGKVAQTFEDTVQVDVPQELLEKTVEHSSLYWKAVPLRPGRYRIDIVVKDVNGDRVGTWSHGIVVPEYVDDKLAVFVADPVRPHGKGADQERRLRQLRAGRNQADVSAPGWRRRQAGQLQARSAHGFVDAGL